MDEICLKKYLSQRIAFYRRQNGWTQAELAEKINYSDKSVSKWERGEGLPDIVVLAMMAELFGVTVDDLIREEAEPQSPAVSPTKKARIIIPMLAVGLVLLAASIVYWVLHLVFPDMGKLWIIFIYAIPLGSIVALILLKLWWSEVPRFLCVTVFIWSSALSVYLTISLRHSQEVFVIAAILQLLIILWYILKINFRKFRRRRQQKKGQSAADSPKES